MNSITPVHRDDEDVAGRPREADVGEDVLLAPLGVRGSSVKCCSAAGQVAEEGHAEPVHRDPRAGVLRWPSRTPHTSMPAPRTIATVSSNGPGPCCIEWLLATFRTWNPALARPST
ncbi:MAG: hypothetical protein R2712_22820 [Vicinamibacterales bacterium]